MFNSNTVLITLRRGHHVVQTSHFPAFILALSLPTCSDSSGKRRRRLSLLVNRHLVGGVIVQIHSAYINSGLISSMCALFNRRCLR